MNAGVLLTFYIQFQRQTIQENSYKTVKSNHFHFKPDIQLSSSLSHNVKFEPQKWKEILKVYVDIEVQD